MLKRWKLILTNWNNCYFSENLENEQKINNGTLVNIISHLRQNYNLDESKSSVLEAHTVKDFLIEKYPEFKFENGAVEPKTEDEIYMVASLLLFFVCVNSKDVDIKNAMCSKLCSEDQQIILKFSKSLLECSPIHFRDVQTAITESCGQDIAAMEVAHSAGVSETPPALRSLHSEVRRLQAALDAERFDKNFLQEELARTNVRVDKLVKEKEQHKLDIVNLKAKISLCGEDSESKGVEADDRAPKLARQLHDLEEKLVETQEQLDNVLYQRDTYKAKVDELKHERDKWLTLHQEETTRVSQLSEQLDDERRQNHTLQELLAELRQHNMRNGLDSSLLECDDPDASIHSMPHNASMCSEVCANVVEVQLGEERAKIVVLQQQIQALQDQMNELNKKSEAEKLALKDVVAERELNIFNLKHRINEEIEDKNNLKSHYDNEITKLNNEINELEQTLKDNNDHSRAVIEKKMQEIQTLQEEKLSLLQSFNNEKTKLEKIIQDLKTEIDSEKQSKSNMKDSYENHLMKLNEKVLKRNNEVVEFQNKICEKSEIIETLQIQLKKEKEAYKTLGDYCNSLNEQKFAIENDLKLHLQKINELQNNLQVRNTTIEDLNIEISNLKASITNLNGNCKDLESTRDKLVSEVKDRDGKIEESLKDIEHIKQEYCKEKEKLILDLNERNETVNSLQVQLKDEINFKIELQSELTQLNNMKTTLTDNLEKLELELSQLKSKVGNNEKTIDAMDLYIKEEKKCNEHANEKIQKMSEDIIVKENVIKQLTNQLETVNKTLDDEIKNKYDLLSELGPLNDQVKSLCNDNAQLEKYISVKCQETLELRDDVEELSHNLNEKEAMIQALEHKFIEECKKYDQFELKAASEMTKLTNKINETNNIASECANVLSKEIVEKESLNNKLNIEVQTLKGDLAKAQVEIEAIVEKSNLELSYKNKLEEDYQNQFSKFENLTKQFNSEIESKNSDIGTLKSHIETLTKSIEEKTEEVKVFQQHIKQEIETKGELVYQMQMETKKFQSKIAELEALNEEIEQELKKETDAKELVIEALKQENVQLHNTIKQDSKNHEVLIKEKDALIDELEQTVNEDSLKYNMCKEELKKSLEELKNQTTADLQEKESEIMKIKDDLLITSNHSKDMINKLIKEKDVVIEQMQQSAKQEAEKFKNLHDYSEDVIRTWQVYKVTTASTISDKEEVISNLENKITSLQEELEKAEKIKVKLSKTETHIEKNKKVTENIKKQEKSKRDLLKTEKEKLVVENKALLIEKEQLLEKLEHLTQEITLEKRAIKTAANISDTERKQLTQQNNALVIKKDELLAKIQDLTQELTVEKCITQKAEDKYNALLSEKTQIKECLDRELDIVTTLLQDKESLTQQLVEEKKLKEILEKERDTLAKDKVSLREKLVEGQRKQSEACQELKTVNRRIKELNQTIEEGKKLICILEEERDTLTNELDQIETKNINLMKENKNLVLEVNDLKRKASIALEESRKKTAAFKRLREMITKQNDELTASLKAETNKVEMLETEKADLISRVDVLSSEMNELQKTSEELSDNLNAKQIECDEITDKLKEKEEEISRLQETIAKNIAFIHETEAIYVQVKENEIKLIENIDKLRQERDKVVSENNKLLCSLETEKTTCDEVETKKNILENKLCNLEAQFKEIKNNLTGTIDELKITCDKTAEQLNKKETKLIETETELKRLKEEHESTQDTTFMVSEAINNGLNQLLLKFKTNNFYSPILQKVIEKDENDIKLSEKCGLIINIANALTSEIENLKNLEISLKNENLAIAEMQESLKQKEIEIFNLKTEVNKLQQIVNENKIEVSKKTETYSASMNNKIKDIQILQQENQTLHNDLNDVKVQLEVKVHSLKEKLVDNENVTDKLKKTYECQIDNLNVMITKLSNYLKDKTLEMETMRKDKEQLNEVIEEERKVIKSLENEVKTEKQNIDKMITDFDAERQVLKNMVTVTEAVMEDQKTSLNNVISEHLKAKEALQVEVNDLTKVLKDTQKNYQAVDTAFGSILCLLRRERVEKDFVEKESEVLREYVDELVKELKQEKNSNASIVATLETQNKELMVELDKFRNYLEALQKSNDELIKVKDTLEIEIKTKTDDLSKVVEEASEVKKTLEEQINNLAGILTDLNKRMENMGELVKEKEKSEQDKLEVIHKLEAIKANLTSNELEKAENNKLKNDNQELVKTIQESNTVIANLEQLIKHELDRNRKLRDEVEDDKIALVNKCSTLQDYQHKAEKVLEDRQKEIISLQKELDTLKAKVELSEQDSKAKDGFISKMSKEKDAIISTISKELLEEKVAREKCEKELENQKSVVHELNNAEIKTLKKENEQLIRAIGQQETFAALCQEKAAGEKYQAEHRDNFQVDYTSSDNTQSSIESLKTISDLEKIIHDKNRIITTLQHDVTYLKSIIAESETQLLDVNQELADSKENCHQLSSQLKKIVSQKNEELADLKKQVSKMSVTENRATQIIKVSAKYQAIILRRIAEIKSNTILKELTNLGNSNNSDNDLRRSLNAGTVTMEDLENFLETTDRHLKRCSEKQTTLQKERDRLIEVNRINESEIINMRKFLTELSVSFQTFNSVKDMYVQKLSRVISVQRTVRREILSLDSRITDAAMCKIERGYAAVMQDLSECAMNLERWVERCISRTVSVEKIKQAFTSDSERTSLASPSFQNTGLEIQLDELDKSFQKLLEEVARAQKGDGAKDAQATTVLEVRAEYEDKLNRMKAKMKELFNEQMAVFKEKQREEMGILERELQKTRDRMEESKQEYEKYIKQLTKELWNVGEKFLVKNDEAEWLRKKQRSGSLMSLQHVHSSGLIQPPEPTFRPSDASSLRSLPVANNTKKREGRQMHMSDEEGEVFDNRWLKELSTPRREAPPGQRLSELKWRNSLCPPHLKSSYPAETQFAPILDEEDLKALASGQVKPQRKEVGITAYKKPGPPTPSKQAGRLSATGSELRESQRVEGDPHADRKTSTPSRIRNFLRYNKNDTTEGTPRTRRLSNIFRKNR